MTVNSEGVPLRDGEVHNTMRKLTETEERLVFLERCRKAHVILPSNQSKNVDFDLLVIQQNRNFQEHVVSLKAKLSKFRTKLGN